MLKAPIIVDTLLEGDPDEIDARSYFKQANTWNEIELITSAEWRAYLRNLGWKVVSFYRHKSAAARRYGYLTLTIEPKDNHPVDYQDAVLIRDYLYELLEAKFKNHRDKMDYYVDTSAYGKGDGAYQPTDDRRREWNQIDVFIRPMDKENRYYADTHLPYH